MTHYFIYKEDEYEAEIQVTPGHPGTGPTLSDSGGSPPEPPEVNVLAVWIVAPEDGKLIPVDEFDDIADYLNEDGLDDVMSQLRDDEDYYQQESADHRAAKERGE